MLKSLLVEVSFFREINTNCSRRPHLLINEKGVKINIQVDLLILFIGKTRRHNIVNANAELDVTVG